MTSADDQVRLDADLCRLVEAAAARAGIGFSQWVREALLARVAESEAGAGEPAAGDILTQAKALRSEGQQAIRHSHTLLRRASTVLEANLAARFDPVFRATPDFEQISKLDGRGSQTFTSWLEEHVHPDHRDLVRGAVDQAIADKVVFKLKHRILRAGGTTGWAVSRAAPLVGPDRRIAEWLVVSGDVTDAARAGRQAGRYLASETSGQGQS